jgi:hypothetical protein
VEVLKMHEVKEEEMKQSRIGCQSELSDKEAIEEGKKSPGPPGTCHPIAALQHLVGNQAVVQFVGTNAPLAQRAYDNENEERYQEEDEAQKEAAEQKAREDFASKYLSGKAYVNPSDSRARRNARFRWVRAGFEHEQPYLPVRELKALEPEYETGEFDSTKYMTPEAAQAFLLSAANGRVSQRDEPYDTTQFGGIHGNAGVGIYVMTRTGQVYSGPGFISLLHHSSFLAGGDVAAAGEIRAVKGVVTEVSNNSGHYKPEAKYLANILNWLASGNIRLAAVTVDEAPDHDRMNGAEWLFRRSAAWAKDFEGRRVSFPSMEREKRRAAHPSTVN